MGLALLLPLCGLALGLGANEIVVSDEPSQGDDYVDVSSQEKSMSLDGLGGDDTLVGGEGDDSIDGGSGDDFIMGGDGEDVIDGGAGNDRLSGNTLGETYGDIKVDGAPDLLRGGEGDDTLVGYGDETLVGGEGADTLHVIHDMTKDEVPTVEGFDPTQDKLVFYIQGVEDGDEVEVLAKDTEDGIALTVKAGDDEAEVNIVEKDLTTKGMDFSFLKMKVETASDAA